MADIVEIGGGRKAEVQESVVEVLAELLADARNGKIIAVAVASICSDGDVRTTVPGGDHRYKLLGAVTQLQIDIARHNG